MRDFHILLHVQHLIHFFFLLVTFTCTSYGRLREAMGLYCTQVGCVTVGIVLTSDLAQPVWQIW